LLLDIYEPDEAPVAPRPALVLVFGGAFQRGTRKTT
jgi:carboxylesterase type B